MLFLVRFAQVHETFRKPELLALAELFGSTVRIVHYEDEVCGPFSSSSWIYQIQSGLAIHVWGDTYKYILVDCSYMDKSMKNVHGSDTLHTTIRCANSQHRAPLA